MTRGVENTVGEVALPSDLHSLLKEHGLAQSLTEVKEVELILQLDLRQIDAVVLLFLNIYNVLNEVFDVEEGGEVWVFATHCQVLFGLNHHQLVFGDN